MFRWISFLRKLGLWACADVRCRVAKEQSALKTSSNVGESVKAYEKILNPKTSVLVYYMDAGGRSLPDEIILNAVVKKSIAISTSVTRKEIGSSGLFAERVRNKSLT